MAEFKNAVLKKGKHKITSKFGNRKVNGVKSMHNGIDLVGAGSTLDYIIAFADGKVEISKRSDSAGEYVRIDHGNKVFTRYLHMCKGSRQVKVGDKVKKGQVLGYMGNTGHSFGAHLHFDININGEYVNPEPYLMGTKELPIGSKKQPSTNAIIEIWQLATVADGFKLPKTVKVGKWCKECAKIAEKAICKKRLTYKYKNLTKVVQKVVGVSADGKFGTTTKTAVIAFQKKHKLNPDGCVGLNTWKKILNI